MKRRITTMLLMIFSLLYLNPLSAQNKEFSNISAAVQIFNYIDVFFVKNMPHEHTVTVKFGRPDFGGGTIIEQKNAILQNLGTGIIVTKDGWLISNSHVIDPISVTWQQDENGQLIAIVVIHTALLHTEFQVIKDHVFVASLTPGEIASRKRTAIIRYLAACYFREDHSAWDRDRAVLKITHRAERVNETDVNILGPVSNEVFSAVEFDNPFLAGNPELIAIGYPGEVSGRNYTVAYGRLLNYAQVSTADNSRAHLLHSAFISGGSSGGGLLYNNKLIGINTWTKTGTGANAINAAQPITYFAQVFAWVKLFLGVNNLPQIPFEWIQTDPSDDPYKNQIYVGLKIKDRATEKSIPEGNIVIFKEGITIEQADTFLQIREVSTLWVIVQVLKQNGAASADIAASMQTDSDFIAALYEIRTFSEIKDILEDDLHPYVDLISDDAFYADNAEIDENGCVLWSLPLNKKLSVYVRASGYPERAISLTTRDQTMQGPYTVYLSAK